MVERRHRIYSRELDEVIMGLRLQLSKHLESREDLSSAVTAYRCYYRLINPKAGRPDYPDPINWKTIKDSIGNGTILDCI